MDNKLSPGLKDGLSQSERFIPALSPGYVKLDDRDIPDLLKFIAELSSQFNYYNSGDQIEGSWNTFFKSDINTLITLISRINLKKYGKQYERLKLMMKHARDEAEMAVHFRDLFQTVWDISQIIVGFLKQLDDIYPKNDITKDSSLILNDCLVEINKLKYYNTLAQQAFGSRVQMDQGQEGEVKNEGHHFEKIDLFGEYRDMEGMLFHAVDFIDEIFSGIKSKLNHLMGIAEYYLRNNNLLDQQYNPHLGLMIAFMHLYIHLTEQMNGYTEKHLDFYYKDILGISPRPFQPDIVYLFFESDSTSNSVNLDTGEKLMAKVKDIENDLVYKLQNGVTVSKASIAELKTIFISSNSLFSDEKESDDIRFARVYAGNYPVIRPAAFLQEGNSIKSWPILGEDQNNLPLDERTMEESEIGLITGSPLLFLPEGERLVQLTFKFEEKSFGEFDVFIKKFAKRSKKTEESTLIEMLSGAFRVDYTAADGWNSARDLRIKKSAASCISISLKLGYQDKGISRYEQAIHGQRFNTSLPLIRILLNNDVSHNAFALFRNLLLEQVTIKVKVTGFKNLELKNNIGDLSPANPFQIFGPQPSVGAFLSIKNANVFNRYLSNFNIRLEWLDLPRESGGFKTYYTGYGRSINNDSFLIRISSLSGGKFTPKPEVQQRFNLFETEETEEGEEQLEDITNITGIDLKRLEFLNDMQSDEKGNGDTLFKGGAIRITLDAPAEAFGHQLFPQIFPEIALHNSKRFVKTLPVPNQPFIPAIKSISLDYTLEHTEVLSNATADDGITADLTLIHQYPFGFEEIYPKNDLRRYPFLPQFEYADNLYIGIKDLKPGQELSLLFKLEERNFHHTAHKPSPVIWSYLSQKTWMPVDTKDILHDTTNNFINTGIVRIKIPYGINRGSSVLNPDLYWLKASTSAPTDVTARVIAVYPHATTAIQFKGTGNTGAYSFSLPPNSMKVFLRKMQGIQTIWQPFPSFGGNGTEEEDHYRTRISERLRHKQRPVTNRDIEQIILNEFPQILMVKCIAPGKEDQTLLPGINMQIILIPKENDGGQFISNEPKVNLSTLFKVKQFLQPFLSPFIKVEVGNPVYEKVKVVCTVQFVETRGFDEGFYVQELNKDIRRYFCPWLYESISSLSIGAGIYLMDILNYIKGLPYVSGATGFSLVHFFRVRDIQTGEHNSKIFDTAINKVEFIRGSVPEAILIPADDHLITVQKNLVHADPSKVGIGSLPVGDELLISNGADDHNSVKGQPVKPGAEKLFRLIINLS